MQDRRSFVTSLGALLGARALAAAGLGGPGLGCSAGAARADRAGGLGPIGLQLYTVRRAMQADVAATLARVARVGYREVEFAGYFGERPERLRALLERHGLRAPAAHVPLEALRDRLRETLDAAQAVGHEYVVVPWLPAEWRRTLDDYRRIAEMLNRAGAEAARAGVRVAYHNQDFELARIEGRLPYDVLLEETDRALVAMEMDVYWMVKGGQDPLAYFAAHPGRFHMLHVKDSAGPPEHRMVDVGRGTIDFAQVLARRERAGVRHLFVEHDDPADPFAFIEASYAYLRRLET